MQCVLWGGAALPYAEGLAQALETSWSIAPVAANAEARTVAEAFGAATALITTHLDASLPSAPRLRLVQVPAAGYDGIALAALPKGVTLCNCFEHEPAVAEYAMLAMLEWCVRLGDADRAVRAGDWTRAARFGAAPNAELHGRTVAIVGLGRIGRAVARRAKAFGMRVLAANRTVRAGNAEVDELRGLESLAATLADADFVIVACALTPETTGLIGKAALAAMKPSAVIINVARGAVIDEEALWDALVKKRIGGAVIDTWWRYPTAARTDYADWLHRWDRLDNVILSPHLAGWSHGTAARRTIAMARNLDRLQRGQPLENVVAIGGERA
ncbi:MAG: 2-hydroxyacid dehydrogenase [Alphaproteobacteria bacterium]